MLHPHQFQINEAWIIFKLNDAPIRTMEDGAFNCVCLMDAASCFILGNTFIPVNDECEPAQVRIRQLLRDGWQHKQEFPTKLFAPIGQFQTNLTEEAELQGIEVVRLSEAQLISFIREAREAFREYMEQGGAPASPQSHNSGTFDPSLN